MKIQTGAEQINTDLIWKKERVWGWGGGLGVNRWKKPKETPPKKAKQNKQKIIMVKLNFAKKVVNKSYLPYTN